MGDGDNFPGGYGKVSPDKQRKPDRKTFLGKMQGADMPIVVPPCCKIRYIVVKYECSGVISGTGEKRAVYSTEMRIG